MVIPGGITYPAVAGYQKQQRNYFHEEDDLHSQNTYNYSSMQIRRPTPPPPMAHGGAGYRKDMYYENNEYYDTNNGYPQKHGFDFNHSHGGGVKQHVSDNRYFGHKQQSFDDHYSSGGGRQHGFDDHYNGGGGSQRGYVDEHHYYGGGGKQHGSADYSSQMYGNGRQQEENTFYTSELISGGGGGGGYGGVQTRFYNPRNGMHSAIADGDCDEELKCV